MNAVCPYCLTAIEKGNVRICPACETPHHLDCWNENRGCTVFGCSCTPGDPTKIQVQRAPHDYVPQDEGARPDHSGGPVPRQPRRLRSPVSVSDGSGSLYGGFRAPQGREPASPTVNPNQIGDPRREAQPHPFSASPPPSAGGPASHHAATQMPPPYPSSRQMPVSGPAYGGHGYQQGPYAYPYSYAVAGGLSKSRTTFILLAVFLGSLGIHNFYAGYVGRGIAQLLISLLGFVFGGPVITWIWAIIEVCVVDKDNKGIYFY